MGEMADYYGKELQMSIGEYEEGLADPPDPRPEPTATIWVTRKVNK